MTSTLQAPDAPPAPRRRPLLLAGAAAAAAAISVSAVVLSGSGSDAPGPAAKKTVLALGAGSGSSMGMCIALSPETLRGAAHAFEGTVSSIEGGTVSFDVTHWYKGGTEQVVTVSQPDGTVEDTSTFEAGKTYLVAAAETEIAPCSGTGEENADLKAMFEQAFGS
jgi:hypothetical protein